MADGGKFDAEYYASAYPDVVAALGTDAEVLYKHYLEYGIKEGRKPYADFESNNQTAPQASVPDTFTIDLGNGVTLTSNRYLKSWFVNIYEGSIEFLGAKLISQNKISGLANGKVSVQYKIAESTGNVAPSAVMVYYDEDGFELRRRNLLANLNTTNKFSVTEWIPEGTKTIVIQDRQ